MKKILEYLGLIFFGMTFGALFHVEILSTFYWVAAYCLVWAFYLFEPVFLLFCV